MIYFSSSEERCEKFATYLLDNKTTVRDTAKNFGYSKSTVHKDITEKLQKVNYPYIVYSVCKKNSSCSLCSRQAVSCGNCAVFSEGCADSCAHGGCENHRRKHKNYIKPINIKH